MAFAPKRVIFEPDALKYPLGEELMSLFRVKNIPVSYTSSHNRIASIRGRTQRECYLEGKRTLVVGVRRTMTFQACKPSAHYQLPLVTGCPGQCEYCYLMTNLGRTPYVRVYVNIEEILSNAGKYIEKRKPEITVFEGSATSDPVPVEPYTGSLQRAIEFFAGEKYGRFRFVTKFTGVDTLLRTDHNGRTRFRFSVNPEAVIKKFEHTAPALWARLAAAEKAAGAGYPLGFLIAPVFAAEGWEKDYRELFGMMADALNAADVGSCPGAGSAPTFEFITHRFTAKAKNIILKIFPETELEMKEETRKYKYGQFGYGKYVYHEELFQEIKSFLTSLVEQYFPASRIEYFV